MAFNQLQITIKFSCQREVLSSNIAPQFGLDLGAHRAELLQVRQQHDQFNK